MSNSILPLLKIFGEDTILTSSIKNSQKSIASGNTCILGSVLFFNLVNDPS